jgi:hypothetical protein
MWTNSENFNYDFVNDIYYGDGEYRYDAELLDYQNGLYLRLLQLTNNLWMTCLIQH